MLFEKEILEHSKRLTKALSMGGSEKLERRRQAGLLNARERVEYLIDPGSFMESGLFAQSLTPEMRDKTPTDGKVSGFARLGGRWIGIVSNDFTVVGASTTPLNRRKMAHIKEVATKRGFPLVFLGESSGARIPDTMGARGMYFSADDNMYLRRRETPWVNAVLGSAFGSAAWQACMADFNVMRKGACMAVSSAKLVSLATKAKVDTEELGGWRIHSEVTGLADLVVDTDEEALDAIKRFLSYMPSNSMQAPPRLPVPSGSDEPVNKILDLLPEERTKVYDIKKVINAIVDTDSFFSLKERFGRTIVTGLARVDGRVVGVIANNPLYKGGAIDVDACDKVCSFIVLCDSFNVPILFFIDQPGFLIGIESEKRKILGKIINWMNALALCTVPKIAVQFRKNYGQGYMNMGGGKGSDERAAWWLAETSFMDPSSAIGVIFGVDKETDPVRYEKLKEKMIDDTSAYESASVYDVKHIIDPRETRGYLMTMLDVHELRLTSGVGQHLLGSWPTTF